MNLIDKYLMEIGKYLSKSVREDILEELRSNIEEQRAQGLSEEEIIESMGDPREIARSYNPNLNYLIGPEYRETYYIVLGITLAAVTLGLAVAHLISMIFNDVSVVSVIGKLLSGLWVAYLTTFGSVTLMFILINRYLSDEIKTKSLKKKWSIESLKKTRVRSKDNDLLEIIMTIVFNAVAIIFLIFIMPGMNIVGINVELIQGSAGILSLLWGAEIILMVELLVMRRYTTIERLSKVAFSVVITIVVLRLIYNPEFITAEGISILENINQTLAVMVRWLPRFITVVSILGLLTEISKQIRAIFR